MIKKLRSYDAYAHFDILNQEIIGLALRLGRPIKVADLGSGSGRYWSRENLASCLDSKISQLCLVDANLEILNSNSLPGNKVSVHMGLIPSDLKEFPENSFDLVVGFDLIEHLTFHDAMIFLYELDRITKHTSILFTPNGLLWQPPSENNIYNAHISGWTPKQLKSLGWEKVYGHTGFKINYGPYGIRHRKFNKATYLIHLLTLPIIRFFPKFAFSFSAIKYKKNPRLIDQK